MVFHGLCKSGGQKNLFRKIRQPRRFEDLFSEISKSGRLEK